MDLRKRILRTALARPAVLPAVCPGATEARVLLERELRSRGWPLATGPATANLLVLVGRPDPARMDWCEGLWRAMPAPRARIVIVSPEQIARGLDAGAAALLRPAAGSPPLPRPGARPEDHLHGAAPHTSHEGHGEHGARHGAHETHEGHGGHEGHGDPEGHGGHGGHRDRTAHGGHEGHDMGMQVSGLPMADRADDRDGLRLDQLHLPLGPALLDWPAGLVLRLALQGDVVQRVHVEQIAARAGEGRPFWDEPWLRAAAGEEVPRGPAARRLCAAHLDSVGRLLAVAGWPAQAQQARAARDTALEGAPAKALVAAVSPLVRRVGRSRTLRWLTRGVGVLDARTAAAAGVSGPALTAGGDVWDRLNVWLDEAARAAAMCEETALLRGPDLAGPRGALGGPLPPSQALLDVLPPLLVGAEFASARLTVASLDPDLDELAQAPAAVTVAHD
ncbi:hypothetical protein [Streptomyces sp. AM8-1-1]|uniref:hypothetical protein n=1 Tax=Streptomyces sp. AM8-1-1 TaxID=3075825 RepID=UPI0028C3BFE1|nr:hypothetical protein [Streptomyces sp. AM8-1-1]WNO70683.1 hypothetical protein RPQ07_03155 [Streptomyces sp. AM8-1-1]